MSYGGPVSERLPKYTAHRAAGLAAFEDGDWQRAVTELEAAVKYGCRPEIAAELMCHVVESWLNMEDWEEARMAGIRAFRYDCLNWRTAFLTSKACEGAGDREKAVVWAKKMANAQPEAPAEVVEALKAKHLLPASYAPRVPLPFMGPMDDVVDAWTAACTAAVRAGISPAVVDQVALVVQKVDYAVRAAQEVDEQRLAQDAFLSATAARRREQEEAQWQQDEMLRMAFEREAAEDAADQQTAAERWERMKEECGISDHDDRCGTGAPPAKDPRPPSSPPAVD
eukprot:GGOE01042937.1.p1 GENE.GGOE01042937.1~~GGOE01042937.1.p1  ORF type:complete len:290 (-),score=88.82 GGOE01042937.1:110-958(-)